MITEVERSENELARVMSVERRRRGRRLKLARPGKEARS